MPNHFMHPLKCPVTPAHLREAHVVQEIDALPHAVNLVVQDLGVRQHRPPHLLLAQPLLQQKVDARRHHVLRARQRLQSGQGAGGWSSAGGGARHARRTHAQAPRTGRCMRMHSCMPATHALLPLPGLSQPARGRHPRRTWGCRTMSLPSASAGRRSVLRRKAARGSSVSFTDSSSTMGALTNTCAAWWRAGWG